MAYIMDMASGTEFPIEEPSCKLAREARDEPCEIQCPTGHARLQLAMHEVQTQSVARALPVAAVEELINSLED